MASLPGTQPRPLEVHTDRALMPPPASDAPEAWNTYFEDLYRDAAGDVSRIPWADERPCPALTAWLNREAPGLVRPGATVVVVGCGLGEDVVEIADRGYDPIAFDVSPTAVEWARRRHPMHSDRFLVADLFSLPSSLVRHADLVVEINTMQAVHPSLRGAASQAIASLARPKGMILVICRGCADDEAAPEAPPFPMSPRELVSRFTAHGWTPTRSVDDFMDDESPPKRRLRVALKRG